VEILAHLYRISRLLHSLGEPWILEIQTMEGLIGDLGET